MAAIKLMGVEKRYNGITAVRDLTLEINAGEFLAILGPPGAGKTSTLKMIAGVEAVTDGEIYFDGRPMAAIPPNRRNVAMVFESYALYPHLAVFDNIAYPLRNEKGQRGYSEQDIRQRVETMAEMLQISQTLQRRPAQLSGGQRQRVALARTLVRNPDVFLFDEPIAHLDARLRHELRGELKRLQRERKTTTIYATPDYLEAIAMADRVAVLFGGELEQLDTPENILQAPANADVAQFLGDPPMNVLPAEVVWHDSELWLNLGEVEIPAPARLKRTVEQGRYDAGLLIGIRPGDIVITRTKGQAACLLAELYSVERLHRKTVLSLSKGKELIKVNAPLEFEGCIGESFWLELPAEKLLAFDGRSRRILPAGS